MLRRTIDLLKTTAFSSHAQDLSEGAAHACAWRITIDARRGRIRGWYRLKFISPEGLLRRVAVKTLDRQNATIGAFEGIAPIKHYAAYIFLGSPTTSIQFRIGFGAAPAVRTTATLRPISLIEYVWRSLRQRFLHRPIAFLRYFFQPLDPFVLAFDFPRPPRLGNQEAIYQWWIGEREIPAYKRLASQSSVHIFERPSISILMTVCDPRPIYLRKAIESVLRQTADNWQLCIADDASIRPEIRHIISHAAQSDERIKVQFRERRGGIAAACNTALAQASSPYCMCLDHDDMLAPSAVDTIATFLGQRPNIRLIYSDEDKIDQNDNRFCPYFKPNYSVEFLYSRNYFNHLTAYHSEMIRKICGWRSEFDGAQDYDMTLRIVEMIDESQIGHVPMILYHWRAVPGSAALDIGFKPYAIDAGRRALSAHLARRSVSAQVDIVANTMYRVRYNLSDPPPKVSIVIPFRDGAGLLHRCLSSIQEKTTYRNYEIVLVDNGSTEPSTLELLESCRNNDRFHVLHQPGEFNYAALNNRAAEHSRADYLCLLNNDTEVITPGWLEDMVGYASQPRVGCVGAKLYYANGTIQHAGVILGLGGVAGHVFLNRARDDPGHFGRLIVASNYSAVTGACLVVNRSIYMEVGGLDEKDLPVAFNDIDFCIKVKLAGYRNVMTPFAELYHYESSSRGRDDTPEKVLQLENSVLVMKSRYGALLVSDPCYSPHLTLTKDDFSLHAA